MSIFAKSKSPSAHADTIAEGGGNKGENALHRQAGQLLCDRDCNAAFTSRMSPADGSANVAKGTEIVPTEQLAHAVEGGAQGLNLNAEQTLKLLDMNPSRDLYADLVKIDKQQALDLAVQDHRFEGMAMRGDDLAVKDAVSMRRYGIPVA